MEGTNNLATAEKFTPNIAGQESMRVLENIKKVAKEEWKNIRFSSEASIESIREIFKSKDSLKDINIHVEFFRGDRNFVVVAEGNTNNKKGLVIPFKGITLQDVVLAVDLFEGVQVGKTISEANLVSFAEVVCMPKKEFGANKDLKLFWRVTKLGKLK